MKPSHFYFDEHILEKEQALFDQCRFLAHRLHIDENSGRNYYCLPQENDARVLVNNNNGIELLSNVCRHRQAVMLKGSGTTQNIVCPLHGWTYNREGTIQAAPHFDPCPKSDLRRYRIQEWNGLLFEQGQHKIGRAHV